jgi:hypothetical protein
MWGVQDRTMIFVFGSNLAGAHGAGAAKTARFGYGAQLGVGFGRTGNAYALPTKDRDIRAMSVEDIRPFVDAFLAYAAAHPDLEFQVTRIGCGLAGFKDYQIAPLFKGASKNCLFDEAWQPWFGDDYRYWGAFP